MKTSIFIICILAISAMAMSEELISSKTLQYMTLENDNNLIDMDAAPDLKEPGYLMELESYPVVLYVDMNDIRKALKLALKYLEPPAIIETVYRTQAAQLRHEADMIEQREKDIEFIKGILEALK